MAEEDMDEAAFYAEMMEEEDEPAPAPKPKVQQQEPTVAKRAATDNQDESSTQQKKKQKTEHNDLKPVSSQPSGSTSSSADANANTIQEQQKQQLLKQQQQQQLKQQELQKQQQAQHQQNAATPSSSSTSDPSKEQQEQQSWDARCIVVRNAQMMIELQKRDPPLNDKSLLLFCKWLKQQLPQVTKTFPYVKQSGCTVDLSDNVIGPQGLDRLLAVLRDEKVPCMTLKVYRNCLDDSIVDTLVEYLYTQPVATLVMGQEILDCHSGCVLNLTQLKIPQKQSLTINKITEFVSCKTGFVPAPLAITIPNQDAANEHRDYEHGEYDKQINEVLNLANSSGNSNSQGKTNNTSASNANAASESLPGLNKLDQMPGIPKEELTLLAKGIAKGLVPKGKGKWMMLQLLQQAKGGKGAAGAQQSQQAQQSGQPQQLSQQQSRGSPQQQPFGSPQMKGQQNQWGQQQQYGGSSSSKDSGKGGKYNQGKQNNKYDNQKGYGHNQHQGNGWNQQQQGNSWNQSSQWGQSQGNNWNQQSQGGKWNQNQGKNNGWNNNGWNNNNDWGNGGAAGAGTGKGKNSGLLQQQSGSFDLHTGGNNSFDWRSDGGGKSDYGKRGNMNKGKGKSNYNEGGSGAISRIEQNRQHVDIKEKGSISFEYELEEDDGKICPRVTGVTPGGEAANKGVTVGMTVQRLNGLDLSMLDKNQVKEMFNIKKTDKLNIRFK